MSYLEEVIRERDERLIRRLIDTKIDIHSFVDEWKIIKGEERMLLIKALTDKFYIIEREGLEERIGETLKEEHKEYMTLEYPSKSNKYYFKKQAQAIIKMIGEKE